MSEPATIDVSAIDVSVDATTSALPTADDTAGEVRMTRPTTAGPPAPVRSVAVRETVGAVPGCGPHPAPGTPGCSLGLPAPSWGTDLQPPASRAVPAVPVLLRAPVPAPAPLAAVPGDLVSRPTATLATRLPSTGEPPTIDMLLALLSLAGLGLYLRRRGRRA